VLGAVLGTVVGEGHFAVSLSAFLASALLKSGLERRHSSSRGEGLFATKNFPKGVEMRFPHRFCLTAAAAARTIFGRSLIAGGFGQGEVLLAVLAHDRDNIDSPFHPYIASLPRSAPGNALLSPPASLVTLS
jgi:hypothetical protein